MNAAVERLVPAMKKWDVPFDSETGNARKTILNMTDDMYLSAAWKWAVRIIYFLVNSNPLHDTLILHWWFIIRPRITFTNLLFLKNAV